MDVPKDTMTGTTAFSWKLSMTIKCTIYFSQNLLLAEVSVLELTAAEDLMMIWMAWGMFEWFFQKSLDVRSVPFITSKHPYHMPLVQTFLQITCWAVAWIRGVVLWSRNFIMIKLCSTTKSSEPGGWAGPLSITRRALRKSLLFKAQLHLRGTQLSDTLKKRKPL